MSLRRGWVVLKSLKILLRNIKMVPYKVLIVPKVGETLVNGLLLHTTIHLFSFIIFLPTNFISFQKLTQSFRIQGFHDFSFAQTMTVLRICNEWSIFKDTYIHIRGFTKFGIKVLWRVQFLEYLRTLSLKFQRKPTGQTQDNFNFGPSLLKF